MVKALEKAQQSTSKLKLFSRNTASSLFNKWDTYWEVSGIAEA